MNYVIGPTWPRIIKKEFQTHDKKSRLARNKKIRDEMTKCPTMWCQASGEIRVMACTYYIIHMHTSKRVGHTTRSDLIMCQLLYVCCYLIIQCIVLLGFRLGC